MKTKLHPDVRKLLLEIAAFRSRTGMDQTRFGVAAVNDGHLIPRLWSGRQPRLTTIDRVRAFMKKNGKR
jgi:hypothetical protein